MKTSAASCLCVLYLIVVEASGGDVTGSGNDILHVPCTYSVHGGQQHMCWGRGGCPWYGCNDEMIKTDGQNVTWRKSDRYQLLGNITEGDVSLTITGATKEDEGTYCCKIKVNGVFNDMRTEMNVNIEEVVEESGGDVTGSGNDILHVPCTYSVHGGQQHMCWGRGGCPWYGCNDEMIKTDGQNVTWRKSDRYQLLGNITEGDVSLTITGVTKEDEGTYCCKIKVNGVFNDMRTEMNVNIEEAEIPVSTSEMYDTDNDPHNPVTLTAWRTSVTSQETTLSELSQSTSNPIHVIRAIVGTVSLITSMGIIIYIYKFRSGKKTTESTTSVIQWEALTEPGHETRDNIRDETREEIHPAGLI